MLLLNVCSRPRVVLHLLRGVQTSTRKRSGLISFLNSNNPKLNDKATTVVNMSSSASQETSDVEAAIKSVRSRMGASVEVAKAKGTFTKDPRLVAVSKTKPLEQIIEAFHAGQTIFGENYVQELVEKANNPDIPDGLQWHFIGTLQSNKAKLIAGLPRLAMVETVTSVKLANMLNKLVGQLREDMPLSVMVQINTSGEENKGGVTPGEGGDLAKHIVDNCPNLSFKGVMTIGEYGRVVKEGEVNVDFQKLVECRQQVAAKLGVPADDVEVSMGMSGDFEHAIEVGSTNIRVGSTIFGARNYANK